MALSAISSGFFSQTGLRRSEAFDPTRRSEALGFGVLAPSEAATTDPRAPIAAVRPIERRAGRTQSDTFDSAAENNQKPQDAFLNSHAVRAQLEGGFSAFQAASAYLAQSLAQSVAQSDFAENVLAQNDQARASAVYRAAQQSSAQPSTPSFTFDLQIDDARYAHLSAFDVTI